MSEHSDRTVEIDNLSTAGTALGSAVVKVATSVINATSRALEQGIQTAAHQGGAVEQSEALSEAEQPTTRERAGTLAPEEMPPSSKLRKGDYYAVLEMQGRREGMEDTSCVIGATGKEKDETPDTVLFGVFDGHGGEECATYCKDNMCQRVAKHEQLTSDPSQALIDCFLQVDDEYVDMARELDLDDGSTATVLHLQYDTEAKVCRYHLACTGDSRAILVRSGGEASPLSDDHVPSRADERLRVENDGGQVLFDVENAIFRVASPLGGGLAVTRAIGDMYFKPFVTALPEVSVGDCGEEDLYICLASDGLWGDVENKEAAGILCDMGMQQGIKELANTAYLKGSEDNITIVVVDLKRAAKALQMRARKAQRAAMGGRGVARRPSTSKKESDDTNSKANGKRSSRRDSKSKRLSNASGGSNHSDLKPVGKENRRRQLHFALSRNSMTTASTAAKSSVNTSRPSMHRRGKSSGILIISGLDPEGFVTELVLWKKPLRSGLWFTTILLVFFLTNVVGYSLLTLSCYLMALQMLSSAVLDHSEPMLKRFGILSPDFSSALFIRKSTIFTDEVVQRAASTVHNFTQDAFDMWDMIVYEGSTRRVLVALRNVSYLFTPVDLPKMLFISALALFSLPVTYVNNRITMDVYQARLSAWWSRTSARIAASFEPLTDFSSNLYNRVSATMDAFFSMIGVINKEKLSKLMGGGREGAIDEQAYNSDSSLDQDDFDQYQNAQEVY